MTQTGARDVVAENRVTAIGPRDDDAMPDPNAPEVILTEAYRLTFEGVAAATSAGGRVVRLAGRQGWQAGAGAVVATVSGPHAGRWTRVAQAIDADTYLLDDPLPDPAAAIVVTAGFVDEVFEANVVDSRGSRRACNLVLVGNHYGTRVVGNRFFGGGVACKVTAAPTEEPVLWGWSHAPMLDVAVDANWFVGSAEPGVIGVEHGPAIHSSRGRLAMSVGFRDNTFVAAGTPRPWVLGDPAAPDRGELRVDSRGNVLRAPGAESAADAAKTPGRPAPVEIAGEEGPH